MRSKFNGLTLGGIGFIVLLYVSMSWIYPYAGYSLNKSITYDADSYLVEDYVQQLNDLTNNYETVSNDDLTHDQLQYLLQMYEQGWMMSDEPVKMNQDDIDQIAFEVKEARNLLLSLAFEETYLPNAKMELKHAIENNLAIEESVYELRDSQSHSRETLQTQYHNLHGMFENSLRMLVTFYERYDEEKAMNE
ncbi:hypothetical protein Q9251_01355 [Alkalihalobacillus macyae]|uniref:hypothetical protein n=1 Tax=Guptibacillus hwajinpoensis TaxID=208199 RepID=UPI00273B1F5E|nr:hypothetical protein [Alkalihalobacillus macyae]MDP4549524.1 hypothetical protein [Alkalihalobacillus macyae]